MLRCTAMRLPLLLLESVLIYLLPPMLVWSGILPKMAVMPLLWSVFLYTFIILLRSGKAKLKWNIAHKELHFILGRFLFLGTLAILFAYYCYPALFLSFPKEHFAIWFIIMLLYPLVSALPQEIIFRAFFTYRFEVLLPDRILFLFSNALLFAYVHTVYSNMIAVLFSFLGALLFMSTYLRTRSVTMSTIEHLLYGNLIFTLGLGRFFYNGG